ncbi:MAG: serine hydroxymethyltransferase [Oscillospiraceae bacterium]|nr:serine hydroxymethyltransferase [Oscillospiraceae bacterium]
MFNDIINTITHSDPEIGQAIRLEHNRQQRNLELIASENIASPAVLLAMSTVLNNKYAEGYPGHRYYGGCEHVDVVETIAIERCKKLFGATFANVQPHSGSQANFAAYQALVKPGDTVMGMNLAEGGHLTHGSPANFSGKLYNIVSYGVDPVTHYIDYEAVRKLAQTHRPKMIVAGASAYPRVIDFPKLREICDEVGAFLYVDIAHIAGLVAGGVHPSPVPYADVVTSTTHKTLRGPRGGFILTNNEKLASKIDKAVFPGAQGGPLMHVVAAKAIAFNEALSDDFRKYQQGIVDNAKALATALASGLGQDKLVSGGTDNHLMLLDLRAFGITGIDLQHYLDRMNVTANKNAVPGDTSHRDVTSGVRLGTPTVTARGMGSAEMREIASLIETAIKEKLSGAFIPEAQKRVKKLVDAFPLYAETV